MSKSDVLQFGTESTRDRVQLRDKRLHCDVRSARSDRALDSATEDLPGATWRERRAGVGRLSHVQAGRDVPDGAVPVPVPDVVQ